LQGPCEADHALALDADTIKTIAHLKAGAGLSEDISIGIS
jgi:hypothetical protein